MFLLIYFGFSSYSKKRCLRIIQSQLFQMIRVFSFVFLLITQLEFWLSFYQNILHNHDGLVNFASVKFLIIALINLL